MTISNVAEESAARAVVERIGKAWEVHDADGFADTYTVDASMILSGDRYLKGRETIRHDITQQFKSAHRGTTLLQDIVDVRFLSSDCAVLITEGGVLAPGETEPAEERALRATWVVVKENGEWLIAAYQNNRRADQKLPGT